MNEKEYLTKEKYEELKRELEDLKTNRRKEVAENLEYAKSLGDLSENAEYHEAREIQATIEDRINKLESILKSAVIVSAQSSDVVAMGSIVVVRKEGSSETSRYQVVGSEEADTTAGKISNRSPLGQAMLGHKSGDKFSFTTPKGKVNYEVVRVG